ncbi:hypothetical protein BH11PSE13_BH11PSE13_40380 [soil metagenome]
MPCEHPADDGWIRVQDRLPPKAIPVLAVISGKGDRSRVCLATHWRLGKGYSGTDPEGTEGSNAFLTARVTHWRPLFLPPAQVQAAPFEAAGPL